MERNKKMKTFNMEVTDKRLTFPNPDEEVIVCGNGDYQIKFTFDAEWNAHSKKTARFTWNGEHHHVEFTGNTCVIPMVTNTGVVTVGVFAGEDGVDNAPLATTKVSILCIEGSRCGDSTPNAGSGGNYTNEARGYANDARASANEAKEYADGLENAIAMKKGHSYTLACQDIDSFSGGGYPREINKRFIADGKLYNKMRIEEPDWDLYYSHSLYYDDELAYGGDLGCWALSNEVVFVDELTDAEKDALTWLTWYEGSDNGAVDVYMCGDKFLGFAAGGEAQWNTVTTHPYFQAHINTPLYEIRIFDPISTNPGVYSIRLRHANDILANFTMVCNGDIAVGNSIYSTPCYCTELNKMIMLEMKHHRYENTDGGEWDIYYEDHHLIHVKDMNGNDVTDALIGLHEYDWCHDNYNNYYGGLEYIKLA